MCRSIKVLRVPDQPATGDEISAAALQFVRKVSGYRKPSRANEEVFNRAIVEISGSVERLLDKLAPSGAGPRPALSEKQSSPANGVSRMRS
jgi:hypothetical protein